MRQITESNNLRASIQKPLALFAWTAWSEPCHLSRRHWTQAQHTLAQSNDCLNVDFASIDLTAQEGGIWNTLEELLADQDTIDARLYMYAGAGSVAWINDGKVLSWILNAAIHDSKVLVARTIALSDSVRWSDE